MEQIILKDEKFYINDIDLKVDPLDISVYKEGLSYSWKTLRTKSSSKILNGNSIFHLKLNLIFTKSMFLDLHRLVCQTKNSPIVQIENEFVSESVSGNRTGQTFFTVNSLQIVPRTESPYALNVELDLRYFNHKVYSGEFLKYRQYFETKTYLKENKAFSKSFDVSKEGALFEYEIENSNSINKKAKNIRKKEDAFENKIEIYNKSFGVINARDSYSYIRYSNYLQVKSLKENFGLDFGSFNFSKFNKRSCIGLHRDFNAAQYIIDKVYQDDGYYTSVIQYKRYVKLSYTKNESKAFKKYINDKVKGIDDYQARLKKIAEIKKDFLANKDIKDNDLKSIKEKIKGIENNKAINIYTGRQGVNNVFYTVEGLDVLKINDGNLATLAPSTIGNISCGFTNLISNLPISGQEFPAHQFLGSTEPLYNINIVGKQALKDGRGLSVIAKNIEKMRSRLQKNAIDFKMIPDAGYFHIENFFTKLLGSHVSTDFDAYSKAHIPKYIMRNLNVNTIEGAPGSQVLQFSFYESSSFKEEELKPVSKLGDSNSSAKKVETYLNNSSSTPSYNKITLSKKYTAYNWTSKYFTADEFYAPYENRGRGKRRDFTNEADRNAYDLCSNILDVVQEKIKSKLKIFSSVDHPKTGIRKTSSKHFSCGAVDVSAKGYSPIELMKIIYDYRNLSYNVGVIGYYKDYAEMESNTRKMNGVGERNFFVHIDDRTTVARINPNGLPVKNRADASTKDTLDINYIHKTRSYFGLDIGNTSIKKINSMFVKDWIATLNLEIAIPETQTPETNDDSDSIETEELIKGLPSFRDKARSTINPFSDNLEEYNLNVESEIKKIKDLTADEKVLVEKAFSLNELNPELEVRIFTGEDLNDFKSKLKDGNFRYAENVELYETTQVFVPITANNFNIARNNKEARALIDMYDNLHLLANLMLTEPETYVGSNKVTEEVRRINNELKFKEEIKPEMLLNFFKNLSSAKDYGTGWSLIKKAGSAIAGVVGTIGLAVAAWGSGGLALLALGVLATGSAIATVVDFSNLSEIEQGGVNLFRGLENFKNFLKAKKVNVPNEATDGLDVADFYLKISQSDQVSGAFTNLATSIVSENIQLEVFSNSLADIKNKTKLFSMLGSYNDVVSKVENENLKLKSLQSEEIYVGELRRIFEYYFGFPYESGSIKNEYDFGDLVSYDKAKRKFLLKEGKKHNSSKPKQYHIVNTNKDEFALTKEELLENQNKKIAYLKLLKETIIEAMLENSDVAEQIGVNKDISIFELVGENAYPDIILPTDPAKPDNNLNLHPTFYFQTALDGLIKRYDYINPNMKKNIENIVGKSYDFEEALRKGVYTGDTKNLPSKELNVDNYETIENTILIDGYNGVEKEVDSNSENVATVLESDSSSKDLVVSQVVNQRIQDFKDLRKTFDDVFGDITSSEKNINDSKKDFKTKEEIIKDTIDACKGLMLPKKTIKKAFPTYRLYLIEEDSLESNRLSVFDDFYTYSGLKSFTVFSHKNMPASTAVIQMQNISGVLDGTKPEVVRDIDIEQNLTPEEEKEKQRSVESIIIRPGINIQLRAGYHSNPNKLKIIFTGRVTEVKNSGSGEMLEITAQSFGIELISKKLGLHPSDPVREKSFYNTHSLLGSLMLREELAHFGRVKKGKKFQVGEAKQPSIDISTGKYEDWFNFSATNWIEQTLYDYGIYIAAASLIIPAAGRLASLRALKAGSNSAVLDFIKGNKLVELFKAVETFEATASSTGKAATALNFVLNASKKIFIDLPVGTFKIIAGSSTLKKAEALLKNLPSGVGNAAVNRVPAINRARNLLQQILTPKELARLGVTNARGLSTAQIDNIIINKFGFSFALANNLLAAPKNVSYFRALLNGAGAGTVLFGDIFSFGPVFRNVVGFYAASIVLGTLIDAVIGGFKGIFYGGIRPAYEYLAGKYDPPSVKILLSPQDDNIFPPPPEEYLVERNKLDKYLSMSALTNAAKRAFSFIGTYGTGLSGFLTPEFLPDGEAKKIMKNAYLKGDTRLVTNKKENLYQIEGSTIWEILYEMSLRHPGYLYGVRQYGSGLESRVFFGQSSQRMFSKDFSNREIETLNKIDNALLRLNGDDVLSDADFEDILGKVPDKEVKAAKTLEVINYWIEKTKERFIPYRQFHNIDSEHDIISNSLRVDASKVVNQVSVTFKSDYARSMSGSESDEIITKIKAIPYIKENMINEKGISYSNCKGLANASRYGMSELINSAKQMYSGEILVVGNPEIRTDDICIINDDYLNMHGLIEVEAVTHMFSFENGFVTEIIPNAVAYGKDKYLSNMISGSLVFDSHRKLIDKYPIRSEIVTYDKNGNPQFNDAKLEALARETVRDFYTDSNSGVYNAIYGSIPLITDYASNKKANNKAIQDIKKQLKKSLENNELIFLSDITENINVAGQAKQILGNSIDATTTIAGGTYGIVKLAEARHGVNLTSLARSSGRTALIMLGTALALKKVGGFTIDGLESSFKTGTIGKNLFRDILMTQVSHGNLIRLLPLVKDGKPLVAGGYEYIQQKDRFKEVFGSYFNPIRDSIEGFREELIGLEEDAQLLGVRKYAGEFGFRSTVSAAGEYVTNGAISSEVFRLKFGEEDN
jgi:hypothetical protein